MKTAHWLWITALVVAILAGHYQRTTGPTYPISGKASLGTTPFGYRLERTHAGAGDQRVVVRPGAADVDGTLEWRPTSGVAWNVTAMRREGDALVAAIPHQPVAGKVAYRVTLRRAGREIVLPPRAAAVIRFRNEVPAWVLVPHVLAMLAALLLAARAALEALRREPRLHALTDATLAALVLGGFVLGPLVSGYAFGAPWSGFPVGNDPTDNKTLIALIGWIAAVIAVRRARHPGPWVLSAAILTFLVYMIPHSISAPG